MVESGRRGVRAALVAAVILASGGAQAALTVLPDSRFVYDDVLDVTWLRDANAALGSSFDTANGGGADGRMNWANANAWASSLSFTLSGSGGSATFDQWRLPTATEVVPGFSYANDGSGTAGYNITRPSSELSYMYYQNLSNVGYYSTIGNFQPAWTSTPKATFIDVATGQPESFQNLQGHAYWSGTAFSLLPSYYAWAFYAGYGSQDYYYQGSQFHAWAVHSGRVMAPVPEPSEWLMMAAGLGVVGWVARGRRRFGSSGALAP